MTVFLIDDKDSLIKWTQGALEISPPAPTTLGTEQFTLWLTGLPTGDRLLCEGTPESLERLMRRIRHAIHRLTLPSRRGQHVLMLDVAFLRDLEEETDHE